MSTIDIVPPATQKDIKDSGQFFWILDPIFKGGVQIGGLTGPLGLHCIDIMVIKRQNHDAIALKEFGVVGTGQVIGPACDMWIYLDFS